MPVSISPAKKSDSVEETAPAAPVTPVAQQKTKIELALYERFVKSGTLYVKGTIYIFPADKAAELLRLHENGKPIFLFSQPKKNMRTFQLVPPEVDMSNVNAKTGVGVSVIKTDRIDIGDESELKEMGIVADDGVQI